MTETFKLQAVRQWRLRNKDDMCLSIEPRLLGGAAAAARTQALRHYHIRCRVLHKANNSEHHGDTTGFSPPPGDQEISQFQLIFLCNAVQIVLSGGERRVSAQPHLPDEKALLKFIMGKSQ